MLVGTVTLRILNRPWPYVHLAPMRTITRRVYRAGTRIVGPAHNDYGFEGERLNGDPARRQLAPALDLSDLLVIAHDNRSRQPLRDAAAQTYRRVRRAAGIEASC
jgi:hypothetical protein